MIRILLFIIIVSLFPLVSCHDHVDMAISFHSYHFEKNRIYVNLYSPINLNCSYYNQQHIVLTEALSVQLSEKDFDLDYAENMAVRIEGYDSTPGLLPFKNDNSFFYYSFEIKITNKDYVESIPFHDLEIALKGLNCLVSKLVIIDSYTNTIYSNDIFLPTRELLDLYKLKK